MENDDFWAGWKDISLDNNLIGETVTKGSGIWEKKYTYIKIPKGYGYDNYCFLLSSKCVQISENKKHYDSYFSICHNMDIELIYDPDLREAGKKYKRFKLKGYELFNNVFKDYELNFYKEAEERMKREKEEKEIKNKKKIGRCVCGLYRGNNSLFDTDLKYTREECFRAFFQLENGSRFANKRFNKVENVKVIYEICDSISKYEFDMWEDIINAYLIEFQGYYEKAESIKKRLEMNRQYSKTERKLYPELMVKTNLNDIAEYVLEANEKAMNDVKIRLQERVINLRGVIDE